MDNEELNSLVVLARSGDIDSAWKVKSMFHSYIHSLSDINRNDIDSQASFEADCFKSIDYAISQYEESRGNAYPLIVSKITERLTQRGIRSQRKRRGITLTEIPTVRDEDTGRKTEDLLEDTSAPPYADIVLKEMIALLAEGDPLKLAILNEWAAGEFNKSRISVLLAQNFGGNPESHRKQVTRFRSHCQTTLAHAV